MVSSNLINYLKDMCWSHSHIVLPIYEGRLFVCFCLSHWDVSNHGTFGHALCTIENPSISRDALTWFHYVLAYDGKVIEYRKIIK